LLIIRRIQASGSLTYSSAVRIRFQTLKGSLVLDPQGFISDHDAGVAKPHVAIYQTAAQRVGVPIGRCLYVGENLAEVLGALAAGMKAILKPCPPSREMPG
jgi:beta-phosphoglucomutase-like phosphatase (HAD superfamily)